MSLLSRLAARFGYVPASEAVRTGRRAYAAAKLTNLTSDWITSPVTADVDLRSGMVPVRVRARDLAQNNDYAKAYLRALKKTSSERTDSPCRSKPSTTLSTRRRA